MQHIPRHLAHLLELCAATAASDLHISGGGHPWLRLHGELRPKPELAPWTADQWAALLEEALSPAQRRHLLSARALDLALSHDGHRFRVNIYHERGEVALAIRRLDQRLRSVEELLLPPQILELTDLHDGLVIFTGPTGSGKSTSLAALVDRINSTRSDHILTIEDPIEYWHENKLSLVHQRELGPDVSSFANSLREALREDPDVILVGEMRDLDTMRAALTAAETGHLVFSTLHCGDTVGALDRMLAMYPAQEQESVRRQLAQTLRAVVAQRLLPRVDCPGRAAVCEVLRITPAVANLVRTAQFQQIYSYLETGSSQGLLPFDVSLGRLVGQGTIDRELALSMSRNRQLLLSSISPSPGAKTFSR